MKANERRGRSRAPLKLIMVALLVGCGLWLAELYIDPTWAKIRSFLLGYFLGTFVMEWIRQRAERGTVVAPAPAAPALGPPLQPTRAAQTGE